MKKKTIGLPKVFSYYQDNFLWRKYLKYLNCNLVISPSTNEEIELISSIFADDINYNDKIYIAHIFYLINKCDYILVERNFLYEDVIRILPNISLISYKKNRLGWLEFICFFKVGYTVNKNIFRIIYAYVKAKYKEKIVKENIIKNQNNLLYNDNKKVLVVANYDIIYDKYIDNDSYKFICDNNVSLIYANILDKKTSLSFFAEKDVFVFNKYLTGAIFYYLDAVDGIIFVGDNNDMVNKFIDKYQIKKKCLILTDNEDGAFFYQIKQFLLNDVLES